MREALQLRTLAVIALVISYFIVVGADLYGQIVIAWTTLEAPPKSLAMLQGEYVYDSAPFWKVVTTIPLILFAVSTITNWNTSRRRLLLISFVAFFAINALSFPFVFHEYLEIVSSPYSDTIDLELQRRGAAWKRLAIGRCALVVAVGILPLLALSRPVSAERSP